MPTTPTKVVFLIDEQPLMKNQTSLEQIKLSIMRILLFYHTQLRNSDIQWSYRFFSTQTRYAFNTMRYFTPISRDSLDAIEMEYEKREKERTTQVSLGTPIMRIKQVLKEALGDFQWENTDLCTSSPTKNYIYLFTGCPSDLKQMNQFFVSPVEDDQPLSLSLSSPSHYPQFFQQTKEELSSTLLKSYTQRQITISILDTNIKYPLNNPSDQHIDRIIRQGFESCLDQFNGRYIPFELITRNYSTYGHSYVSEFSNILPHPDLPTKKEAINNQMPVWKGPFKTKLGKTIGDFVLYPSCKRGKYQTSMLNYISEIRTISIVHASQFPASWLLVDDPTEPNHDYKFTYEPGQSSYLINTILDQLFATQQVLIAELIPMAGYEELSRNVCIEPFSRSSASLRFLNIQHLPSTVRLRQVVVDDDHPVGSFIDGTKLGKDLPFSPSATTTDDNVHLEFEAPSFIKRIFQTKRFDTSKIKQRKPNKLTQKQKEEQVEKTIQLPSDVNMMGKALKKLYLELLYTQEETLGKALIIIDQWITHLLKNNHTKQEIISTLFDYTMPMKDLEEKYREKLTQSSIRGYVGQSKLEQAYLDDWWRQVKDRSGADNHFIQMCHTILKLKEARLQVILYCFIARLSINVQGANTKRDPLEMAESFFKKTVLAYSWHNITEFLEEMDNDEGPHAVKRRDPADLHDYVLMQILEKCFSELPHLTSKFREIVGMDELASAPSSPSSPEEFGGIDDLFNEDLPEVKEGKQRPTVPRRVQSDRPTNKRPHYDNNARKMDRMKASMPFNSRSSNPLLPLQSVKIQRSSSNKMFDSMLKRTVDVPKNNTNNAENNRGEATQEAIAKVNRSSVNGRPTIKRTGSFTKSAQSPKRIKRSASMLSHGETGTVILRRETIPNPQITPRTSLNRHLGTNIFQDYSELCLSPSSRTTGNDDHLSVYAQSEYPQGSTTPQGTPNRYRKVMMNHTPHRENDDDEFSISRIDDTDKKHPPYTPRTAAKRAKDVIDRSKINPGRNLTTQFQDLLEEEKMQDKKTFKSSYNIFDDDDDDEDEENKLAISKNENINPFLTGSESPTRPIMRRAKTLDIFDESLEFPRIGLPHFGSDNVNMDDDSDTDGEFSSLARAQF